MVQKANKSIQVISGVLISVGIWGIVLNIGLIPSAPLLAPYQTPYVALISFILLLTGYFLYIETK